MNLVEAAWEQISATPPVRHGLSGRRLYLGARIEVFAALDRPKDIPVVFVNLRKRAVANTGEIPKSSGFEVRLESCEKGSAYVRVLLQLSSAPYRDVFAVLADDVLACIAGEADDHSAANAMLERLRRWQDFLLLHGPDGMGETAQRGLYGELWFLREYAMKTGGTALAIGAWSGPERTHQDFQFSQGSVEVKTTANNPHHQVKVSSVRQLDETGIGGLILLHIALEVRQELGESLSEIVSSVRLAVSRTSLPLSEFEAKLRDYGYLDAHSHRYQEPKFIVRSHAFYRVERHFPRLRESEIPAGVGDVTYSVALSACADFQITTALFITLLQDWTR